MRLPLHLYSFHILDASLYEGIAFNACVGVGGSRSVGEYVQERKGPPISLLQGQAQLPAIPILQGQTYKY